MKLLITNRLIFVFSLLGLGVSVFLLYEYSLSGPVVCPLGGGCDIVRSSIYSHFLGISLPVLGIAFYLMMAILSIAHSQNLTGKALLKLQLFISVIGVSFGIYLTYLEAFVIKAYCFWCVLSFIISIVILALVFTSSKVHENRD